MGTPAALRWLATNPTVIVPDLVLAECASVVWTRVRRKLITRHQADGVTRNIMAVGWHVVPTSSLSERALEIAFEVDRSPYDCVYLALAEARTCPLVTADRRFFDALKSSHYRPRIRWFEDSPEAPPAR